MSKKQRKVFWPGLCLIVLALSAIALVSARTRTNASSAKDAVAKPAIAERAVQSPPATAKQRIEGEIVRITPHGFEPRQITRGAGPFLLVVENSSGLSAVSLLLNIGVGSPLRNALVRREQRTWSDIVDLPPGTYTLREVTHPGWVCNITIR